MIGSELQNAKGVDQLGSGVVITGGTSHLQGFIEMGHFLFDIPVRRGLPSASGELAGTLREGGWATVMGLLIYGAQEQRKVKSSIVSQGEVLMGKWTHMSMKVKNYFSGLFY